MNGKKKLIEVLVSKQHDSRKSWNQICKKIGLSPSVVSKFIHTQSDISVESLNKLLRYFNVDIYHSSINSLADRKFDSTTKVPVAGVSNENGIIRDPRISDPTHMLRSNIWRGYHCILVKHDPVYDYQCLFDPTNDFKERPEGIVNQYLYCLLKYKPQKNTPVFLNKNEVFVFCNAKYVLKKKQVICLDEVTKTEINIDIKNVFNWYVVEALFAPNNFKSSRVNSLHDQVYNQKKII